MATPQHDKFARQYPPRPQIQSQHSSSVPSTPYQAPRDTRFTSRSPSPHRGLLNHSPRSVASEALGRSFGAQRGSGPGSGNAGAVGGAPVVCKFEFAPELPKRRIKYVDGGDQELGPPKKEPKKTLDPDEEDKLSGDLRELYDRLLPSQESEDRRTQLCKKLERILNEEWPGNDIQVNMFGSSGNLLSSSDSDVDICITTDAKALENMHEVAKRLSKHGMEKVVCRAAAKVPIVKCWDPELQLACDVNVNNPLALENTRMIKTYVQLDDRVRPLAKIIKYWTKRRILNDAGPGGTISSYTWICMIINFLQRREPPILPSLQKMRNAQQSTVNGHSDFTDDVESLKGWGKDNKESLAQLLFQFFRHYGYEFEYTKYVVSIREGRLLSRTEKGWETNSIDNKEGRHRLCVEEPFNTYRNLGNSADEYSWSGLHNEIRRAFELLEDGCQIEKACEQYEFPPEERHIFQRPPPKPKPTLTRSASQSGRTNNEGGSGRSRKGTRNQSQRGSRRASSGASYSNQRNNFWLQSPPLAMSASDYFGAKVNLHDQLYQQYMALQMHQDALKSQLLQGQLSQQQAQQVQAQVRGQGNDLSSSPDQRQYVNGISSPRYFNNPPQSAPLLPGYIHHYTARYPPGSPMLQARQQREGTNTNPSSPSLATAMPALRRDVHRTSVADGSAASTRSQSQPGRSGPNAFNMQQYAHPGYDASGALNGIYPTVRSASGPYAIPGFGFAPMATLHAGQSVENAVPKEYLGYIHHQSPQFGPQPMLAQSSLPHLTLQNPPQRQRKGTNSDLVPPIVNGRHSSRSPSPLGHGRSHSTIAEMGSSSSAQQSVIGDPVLEQPEQEQLPEPALPIPEPDFAGPIIVNGSGPTVSASTVTPQQQQQQPPTPPILNGSIDYTRPLNAIPSESSTWGTSLPLRASNYDQNIPPRSMDNGRRSCSPKKLSPGAKPQHKASGPTPRLNFSPNSVPTPQATNGTAEHVHHIDELSLNQGPLLSPVVELRTPSPTNQRVFENLHYDQKESASPQANGDLSRAVKVAAAKEAEAAGASYAEVDHGMPTIVSTYDVSNGTPTATQNSTSASQLQPHAHSQQQSGKQQSINPWQQATGGRKGHKKSKSTAKATSGASAATTTSTSSSAGGQPMPANAAERKGG